MTADVTTAKGTNAGIITGKALTAAIRRATRAVAAATETEQTDKSRPALRNRKGIYQRKDGKYSARYYAKDGKRKEKYFNTLPEAKNWLADAKYEDRHNLIVADPKMTVDKWFSYWIENIVCDLAPNTLRNYRERYKFNIQPVIGAMCIGDVKPMHCKAVLNRMETAYAGSTIRQASPFPEAAKTFVFHRIRRNIFRFSV